MKTERRWLKSAIAAANEPQIALPWTRGARRRPQAMLDAAKRPVAAAQPTRTTAVAAH